MGNKSSKRKNTDSEQKIQNIQEDVPAVDIKEPHRHDISIDTLELLISGYMRNNKDDMVAVIVRLVVKFYPSQLYMVILNKKELKLTLCDSSNDNVKISSNKVIALNELKEESEEESEEESDEEYVTSKYGGISKALICHKTNLIEFNNIKYNSIFKCGGSIIRGRGFTFDTDKDCGIILYPQNIADPSSFNIYYYTLPSFPLQLDTDARPVYSSIYGLTIFQNNRNPDNVVNLNINNFKNNININENMNDNNNDIDIKWNVQELPNELSNYLHVPNYCYVNNENDLFFVNGRKGDGSKAEKTTFIYNLENNTCQELAENPDPMYDGDITFCQYTNKVFMCEGSVIMDYDLHKNEYFNSFPKPEFNYREPLIWVNENGTLVYLASRATTHHGHNIRCEWIDLRTPDKWIKNDNLIKLQWKLWNEKQFYLGDVSVVGWK